MASSSRRTASASAAVASISPVRTSTASETVLGLTRPQLLAAGATGTMFSSRAKARTSLSCSWSIRSRANLSRRRRSRWASSSSTSRAGPKAPACSRTGLGRWARTWQRPDSRASSLRIQLREASSWPSHLPRSRDACSASVRKRTKPILLSCNSPCNSRASRSDSASRASALWDCSRASRTCQTHESNSRAESSGCAAPFNR
mmetsp:Transcript_26390/g.61554  ORF Transcript_26390/g.61554 Transcript_26390/m.61554 type:complete len:203 (-) Transcript_26390:151-759(-)